MVTLPLILVGLGGVVYIVRTWHRMQTQHDYDPVFEDWAWHVALPLIAYVVLGIGAMFLQSHDKPALFVIAAASLLLAVHRHSRRLGYRHVHRIGTGQKAAIVIRER